MRGGPVFLIFFALFGIASYAIPTPLFPGNIIFWFMNVPAAYAPLLESLANGVVYGCIVWLVFILVMRKFEEPKVAPAKAKKSRIHRRR